MDRLSRYVNGSDAVAAQRMDWLVNQAPTVRYGGTGTSADFRTKGRIKGLFYYQLRGASGDFDSGLVDPTTTNGRLDRVRPMWTPWCRAVITRVAGASCDPNVLNLDVGDPDPAYG